MKARATPWMVAAVALAIYLLSLSRHWTGDSIGYALAIELGDPAYLLDPYHPLLHPVGLLFYWLWQWAGWTGGALLPLQVFNAAAGAVCVGLLADIARRISGSGAIAVLVGMGFAVSGGLWLLSVEAEFVTLPLAFALLVLWALLAAKWPFAGKPAYPISLGLGTVLAILSYASGLFLVPVVLVGLLLDERMDAVLRRRQALVYGLTVLLVALPVAIVFLAVWSDGDWQRVSAYFLGRESYGRLDPFGLPHGLYAFLRSLALFPQLSLIGTTRQFLGQAATATRVLFAVYYLLISLAVLAPLWLALKRRHRLWRDHRRTLIVLVTWAILYGAFAFWWVPGDLSFWLPVLAAWWLFAALALCLWAVEPVDGKWPRPTLAAAFAVLVLGASNAWSETWPRHNLATNHPYWVADRVAANAAGQDPILTRGDDVTGLYLAYFGQRWVGYLSPQEAQLDEALAYLESPESPVSPPRRLLLVDSDCGREPWWTAQLAQSASIAAGSWQAGGVGWSPEGSVVVELTSMSPR